MFDKVKSRTEWQAYLVTILVLAADHFLGLEVDPEKLWMLVGMGASYGVSRGLAKHEPKTTTITERAGGLERIVETGPGVPEPQPESETTEPMVE